MLLTISVLNVFLGIEVPMLKSGLATIMDAEEHQPFLVSFLESSDTHKAEKAHRRRPRSAETGGTGSTTGDGGSRPKRNKKTKKGRNYDFGPDVLDRPKSCQMGMLYVVRTPGFWLRFYNIIKHFKFQIFI